MSSFKKYVEYKLNESSDDKWDAEKDKVGTDGVKDTPWAPFSPTTYKGFFTKGNKKLDKLFNPGKAKFDIPLKDLTPHEKLLRNQRPHISGDEALWGPNSRRPGGGDDREKRDGLINHLNKPSVQKDIPITRIPKTGDKAYDDMKQKQYEERLKIRKDLNNKSYET